MNQQESLIISLGGSVICDENVDVIFLKKMRSLLAEIRKHYRNIFIVTGGGKVAREYQRSLTKVCDARPEEKDFIGILATRINAHFFLFSFGDLSVSDIITDPEKFDTWPEHSVVFAGGSRPGWSTDFVAVTLAKTYGARKILNLSNIDYVYDKDPNIFTDAKKQKRLLWKTYRNITPKTWNPGAHVPFDAIASALAERLDIEVLMMNGKKWSRVRNFLLHGTFVGSILSNRSQ